MSFLIPLFFDATPGTATPLAVPAPSYSNETNTAQSRPLPTTDFTGPGVNVVPTTGLVNTVTPAATPQQPAAPTPKASPEASDAQKKRNPLLWLGLAALAFGLFWAVRRA